MKKLFDEHLLRSKVKDNDVFDCVHSVYGDGFTGPCCSMIFLAEVSMTLKVLSTVLVQPLFLSL